MPSIVGFLVAGVLLGPHGLAAIRSAEEVERLAELGIVLLLFVTGLELSLGGVASLGGRLMLAGVAQVVVWVASSSRSRARPASSGARR